MRRKDIVKPEVNDCFFKGGIESWKFREKITPSHGKYAFRLEVRFADGTVKHRECGGFRTKRECLEARENTVNQLNCHCYVFFRVTVKEFFDYWLYYYMTDEKKISYNTFVSYRNIIYNYIVPKIGGRKLTSLDKNDLLKILDLFQSPAMYRMAKGVLRNSFRYARRKCLIHSDIAESAIKYRQREDEKKEVMGNGPPNKVRPIITASQIRQLLIQCKQEEPDLFLPLAITVCCGCRISELIALRFSSVDFKEGTITIDKQLGRTVSGNDAEKNCLYKQEIRTKTRHSVRKVTIPPFVLEEIVLRIERQKLKGRLPPDQNSDGYIWAQENGLPHGRSDYEKPFRRLKESLELPKDLHWHDLRHSFATEMTKNGVNPKGLSEVMGHYDSEFSLSTYVDRDQVISGGFQSYDRLIEQIIPKNVKTDSDRVEVNNNGLLDKILFSNSTESSV